MITVVLHNEKKQKTVLYLIFGAYILTIHVGNIVTECTCMCKLSFFKPSSL